MEPSRRLTNQGVGALRAIVTLDTRLCECTERVLFNRAMRLGEDAVDRLSWGKFGVIRKKQPAGSQNVGSDWVIGDNESGEYDQPALPAHDWFNADQADYSELLKM